MLRAKATLLAFALVPAFGIARIKSQQQPGLSSVRDAQKSVQTIEIRTGWGGLGTPQKNVVTIQRKGPQFISNGKSVSADMVQALVSALSAEPVTKPEMTNLGVTPDWLKANLSSQKPRATAQATETTAKQQQMFNKAFTDVAVIGKALPSLFTYTKFDDYPGTKVDVVFEDGSKLTSESHSYYVFMLPWKVSGLNADTYNAAISRAISALLPADSVNKERLAGNGLAEQLTDSVMRLIEREWNLLGSDERAGDALKKLRTTYEVVTAELTPYHHPEYGTATYKGEPEEMNLHAAVRKDPSLRTLTTRSCCVMPTARLKESTNSCNLQRNTRRRPSQYRGSINTSMKIPV